MSAFSLQLTLDTPEALAGARLTGTVVLHNTGAAETTVPSPRHEMPFAFLWRRRGDERVVATWSQAARAEALSGERAPQRRTLTAPLAPGAAATYAFDLSKLAANALRPGLYTLQAVWPAARDTESNPVEVTLHAVRPAAWVTLGPGNELAVAAVQPAPGGRMLALGRLAKPGNPDIGTWVALRSAAQAVTSVAVALDGTTQPRGWRWMAWIEGEGLGAAAVWGAALEIVQEPHPTGLARPRLLGCGRQVDSGDAEFWVAGLADGAPAVRRIVAARRGIEPGPVTPLGMPLPPHARLSHGADGAWRLLWTEQADDAVHILARTLGEASPPTLVAAFPGRLLGWNAAAEHTGAFPDLGVVTAGRDPDRPFTRFAWSAGGAEPVGLGLGPLPEGHDAAGATWSPGAVEHDNHPLAVTTPRGILLWTLAGDWRTLSEGRASVPAAIETVRLGSLRVPCAVWLSPEGVFRAVAVSGVPTVAPDDDTDEVDEPDDDET